MVRKKYRTISIPEELYLVVEEAVRSGKGGYTSIGEFVKEAVRDRLRELDFKV
mgnify:CR=1 FL=1